MRSFLLIILTAFAVSGVTFGQFGQNKVQYHDNEWYFIQTKHFDVYFNQDGAKIAEFASAAAEDALVSIQKKVNYAINNRISLILYNSQAEFQETNVTDDYLSEGVGGFTELFKNRVVLPFTGNYKMFRHVIHHELVHAVVNDLFYGGSIQNVISNNINIRVPLWFNEGLAEYLSLGWDPNTDMFIRDAIHNDNLPDMNRLDGYLAYRGGQSIFYYISQKYGDEKIGELVNKVKSKSSFDDGLEATLGVKPEEFNERWRKFLKKRYWPDINIFQDPEEFAKKLTDPKKEGGTYNTSPAISPSGTQIAFISNRDFFFDVYIMNAQDGKIIKKLIKGNRTVDFEELNILTPGLTWSPDAQKIALAAKSAGSDVIYIIDVKSEDIETLPFRFPGIQTVHWSPDGSKLAFTAQTAAQSDIYLYDLKTQKLEKLTDDVFSDYDPAWSPDGKVIFFTSDRGGSIVPSDSAVYMYKHDYSQSDVYAIRLSDHKISRITNTLLGDEYSPVCSPDGKQLLFISDKNGINNIYRINLGDKFAEKMAIDSNTTLIPVTNSLNGIYQLSTSADGKKLTFSSMYKSAYNIFVMTNPFEEKTSVKELPPTLYISELLAPKKETPKAKAQDSAAVKDTSASANNPFFTGQYIDSTKTDTRGKRDYSNYVFGPGNYYQVTKAKDTTKFTPIDNMDQNGNYRVNKYKISFSPDIIYANAGFSTFYGLQGATVISFSDVLGNHRLIGMTSLQVDLKNSDYGLAYYYLPKRVDIGIEAFHTARFLYINYHQEGQAYLFRFRNYGVNLSFSYPFNRFYRFDWGISNLNILTDNLDEPDSAMNSISYIMPTFSFIHDNTIFGYTAPIEGTRYRFDFLANPLSRLTENRFYSVLGDYRTYLRFFTDYCFAVRLSGGMSRGGENRQRFFLGGTDNWINRRFASEDLPLNSASDFAFLTAALPMRGFDYAEQVGTTYGLMNMELRFPLIRYLVTGGLPLLFQNVLGTAFIDAGSAWDKTGDLRLLKKDPQLGLLTNDLLLGTGVGARMYLLYFLARFDVAWAYDLRSFSRPVFYFSLGTDF
jgi:Tol biopolymer transport system component